MGRITDYEKVYIQNCDANLTPERIAKELGRSVATIKKWIAKWRVCPNPSRTPPTQSTLAVAPTIKTKDLFVTKTATKNRKFGAIMTQAAAEKSDESSKKANLKTNINHSAIYRPFNED